MLLLRLYDCISLLTTDDALHHWLVNFAVHRTPRKKKENWNKICRNQMNESLKLLNCDDWSVEKTKGTDVISSKNIPNIGKVFRFEGIIYSNIENVKKMLFDGIEDIPQWNKTIQEVKVLRSIDDNICITHSVMKRYHAISSREFVHLRSQGQVNDQSILTCVSISYPEVPENSDIIRAEHRLFSYILRPVPNEPSKTHIIWLMNINLKGWLPQKLVDQTLAMGMLDHLRDIRQGLNNMKR